MLEGRFRGVLLVIVELILRVVGGVWGRAGMK
jgi:hypothetical protein